MTVTPDAPATSTKPTVHTLLQGSRLSADSGDIAFCGVNLIEGADADGHLRRIVVDTGHVGCGTALRRALAARGLTGSDIDTVVLTHAHWDHMQNLDPFDRAVIRVHHAELDYLKDPHAADFGTPRWTKAVLDCFDVRSITGGVELLPGVVVVEAPGHSAGTIALAVTTDDGTAVVSGDSIQDSRVARHRRNSLVFWNEEQANRSVAELVDMADVIYPGHDRAFRLSATGAVEYVQELCVTISGIDASTPGVTFVAEPPFEP